MIPVNEPLLNQADQDHVLECLRTGWISSAGEFVDRFETEWSQYCGMRHGIAVSNGTTALQVAVEAVGIAPGDEVIMPSFTIISCAMPVVKAGGIPVLVDCDPHTFCMKPEDVEQRVTERTKAIMLVHMYGHPVDVDPIIALAERRGLAIIEDAAEVHGARYLSGRNTAAPHWRPCGGIGHISTFSFFANKLITTGEGGMVLTNDDQLAARSRALRNLCFRPDRRFLHDALGYNFRLTNMQAAVGLDQVRRIESIVERKRAIAAEYSTRLRRFEQLQLPMEHSWARSVFWVYSLVLRPDVPMDAALFARKLKELQVETRPFFLGMHEQPVFLGQGLFANEQYPVTETIARRGLYVPSGLGLRPEQLDAVCVAVERALA